MGKLIEYTESEERKTRTGNSEYVPFLSLCYMWYSVGCDALIFSMLQFKVRIGELE